MALNDVSSVCGEVMQVLSDISASLVCENMYVLITCVVMVTLEYLVLQN